MGLKVSKVISWKVRVHSASVRVKLLQMLSTKYLQEGELSPAEKYIVWDSYLFLQDYRDPHFWRSDRIQLFSTIEQVISMMNNHEKYSEIGRRASLRWFQIRNVLPSLHAYYGWSQMVKLTTFLIRVNRALRRKPPPKAFIGVGYGDKGHRREVSVNGTPSWQEVASANLEDQENLSSRLRGIEVWSFFQKRALRF
jgi:hypothetical protein